MACRSVQGKKDECFSLQDSALGYNQTADKISMAQEKMVWGLFRRRQIPLPTWRGWLLFLLIGALFCFLIVKKMYGFLAVNASKPVSFLVVEGWAPDYALVEALKEFNAHPYQKLFATGVPIEHGAPLAEYKTYAELGAATLLKFGLTTNAVEAVPAPFVRQDRTYTSAVALKKWMADHSISATNINVLTVGPHARRTRLLFHKAFGKGVSIGIISMPPADYDKRNWYRSSQGFRDVTGEFIAYTYARLVFRQPKEQ